MRLVPDWYPATAISPQHGPSGGAAGGIRTHTPFRTRPFEGLASTVPPPPHGRPARSQSSSGSGSGRIRGGVAVGVWAGGGIAALELHVPTLREATHCKRDEQYLNGDYQQGEQPEEPGVQRRLHEAGLVTRKPARSRYQGEDAHQHAQHGGDRQRPAVPASREHRESHIDGDEGNLDWHRALEHGPAANRDDQHETGADEQQHDHGRTSRLHDGLVAVGVRDDDAGTPLRALGGGHYPNDHTSSVAPVPLSFPNS